MDILRPHMTGNSKEQTSENYTCHSLIHLSKKKVPDAGAPTPGPGSGSPKAVRAARPSGLSTEHSSILPHRRSSSFWSCTIRFTLRLPKRNIFRWRCNLIIRPAVSSRWKIEKLEEFPIEEAPVREVPAPPRRGASARTPHGEPPHSATRRGGAGTSRADTPYANPNCSEAKSRGPCLPTPYNAFFALKHPVPLFLNAKSARNSDAKDATCCEQGRGGRDKRVPPVADQRQLRPSTVTIRSATAPHTNPEARWLLTTFPVLLFYSRGNETAPTVPF